MLFQMDGRRGELGTKKKLFVDWGLGESQPVTSASAWNSRSLNIASSSRFVFSFGVCETLSNNRLHHRPIIMDSRQQTCIKSDGKWKKRQKTRRVCHPSRSQSLSTLPLFPHSCTSYDSFHACYAFLCAHTIIFVWSEHNSRSEGKLSREKFPQFHYSFKYLINSGEESTRMSHAAQGTKCTSRFIEQFYRSFFVLLFSHSFVNGKKRKRKFSRWTKFSWEFSCGSEKSFDVLILHSNKSSASPIFPVVDTLLSRILTSPHHHHPCQSRR